MSFIDAQEERDFQEFARERIAELVENGCFDVCFSYTDRNEIVIEDFGPRRPLAESIAEFREDALRRKGTQISPGGRTGGGGG